MSLVSPLLGYEPHQVLDLTNPWSGHVCNYWMGIIIQVEMYICVGCMQGPHLLDQNEFI